MMSDHIHFCKRILVGLVPAFMHVGGWAQQGPGPSHAGASARPGAAAPANPRAAAPARPRVEPPALPVTFTGGRLTYAPDELGNRVPDFSYCGYAQGDAPLPEVPVRAVVALSTGDATAQIQAAIDYVSALPLDASGFRGAVLLEKGTYRVSGSLVLAHSGVVLRGAGRETVLEATGPDRRTLIRILGRDDRVVEPYVAVAAGYVPVGEASLAVAGSFAPGDEVLVCRPSSSSWIQALGTDHFGGGVTALAWKPGQRDIYWDRRVVSASGGRVTLDVPLTTALDTAFGGGFIARYRWPGRITHVGVENLRCVSDVDAINNKDEAHSWTGISLENVRDAWVRRIDFEHFAGSAVEVLSTASRVTVEDCKSLDPIGEIGGQRRNTFFTEGGQTLFHRLYAEHGYHDFGTGFCAPGPNAFVDCDDVRPYSFSGGLDSWASGVLFDVLRIDGQTLGFFNREQDGQGAGWNAANSVLWNCSASMIDCYQPPTAENWSFGSWGQFRGDGFWAESNSTIPPRSLYYAQLSQRLGHPIDGGLLPIMGDASSSPTPEEAARLMSESTRPAVVMPQWIDSLEAMHPLAVAAAGARVFEVASAARAGVSGGTGAAGATGATGAVPGGVSSPAAPGGVSLPPAAPPMHIAGGWLLRGDAVLVGKRYYEPWWEGSIRPYGVADAKPAITRFVPGRTGRGFTDDLSALTDTMAMTHVVALDHNYGLWYDRRRDDHERIRRMDGDVWPPFYELPFMRSGRDSAWDGLSKYDLTRYNPWYWSRLRQFADLADRKGLVLIHQNYFQHNIIEAGAHYADFPWRTANNINHTGFPEPPPFAGDKRIFMAEQFYDTTQPQRRALHAAFIRQCLNNFKDNNGVIQLLAAEYTGPLHFARFWVDQIASWEASTGIHECIGLSTTKDVQDSILADPVRSGTIDLIDIRYWYYESGGRLYAPPGGQNMAPRQHERVLKPKRPDFEAVYRSVRAYRDRYPGKAVMYSAEGCDTFGWAVFMAGGSLANIPVVADPQFLRAAALMRPLDAVAAGAPRSCAADSSAPGSAAPGSSAPGSAAPGSGAPGSGAPGSAAPGSGAPSVGPHVLGNPAVGYIVYGAGSVDLAPGRYRLHRIDPRSGAFTGEASKVSGGKAFALSGEYVFWLEKY
ncbi:DUF6298 domain-containing protein [Dinghuibacter silviterrae]|uniref:DUF6298 domain-containing protein n=1 Tax=Dinghuibacter silviterrae TaxID=1539049 RepID=A0A4R8DVZ0_9BACT|nr:DUF6298 domain-containing protein [Dinghuibacter silviterrae]TDX01381.1 hypothetical protein EDB95_2415 [Dinghuibacter silviterrae]